MFAPVSSIARGVSRATSPRTTSFGTIPLVPPAPARPRNIPPATAHGCHTFSSSSVAPPPSASTNVGRHVGPSCVAANYANDARTSTVAAARERSLQTR